jgi:hypothetical protein
VLLISIRKRFLIKLIELSDPRLSNTDVQDVGSALGLPLEEAEAIARALEDDGLIQTAGVGGNIVATDLGKTAAADPNWD